MRERGSTAFIAAVTWGREQDERASKAAGIDRHLTKPVKRPAIEAVLESALERSRSIASPM